MTSTFFSASSGCVAADMRSPNKEGSGSRPTLRLPLLLCPSLALLRAVARRDAFLFRVLRRGLLDHGTHDVAVRRDPAGHGVPLLAVPLQEAHRAAALVVGARHLERLHEVGGAQLLQALLVDVEVLEAPADLLAGHRLALAVPRLRRADGLGGDDSEHDA